MQVQDLEDQSQLASIQPSQCETHRVEDQLENTILEQAKDLENQTQFERTVCVQLEDKYQGFEDMLANKNEEEALNIRMHQLAVAKILVLTHGKHQFRLIQAHTRLGEAYLNFQCYEQTAQHLQTAKRKIAKVVSQLPDCRLYQAFILQLLAKNYIQTKDPQRALELLTHALQIQTLSDSPSKTDTNRTLILMAACYSSQKSYSNALEYLKKAQRNMEADQIKGRSLASVKSEIAKVQALKGNLAQAEECQKKAIQLMVEINYHKPQYVAQQYSILASYQQKQGNGIGYMDSLQRIKVIYQQTFGHCHQKVVKSQRKLATILIRNGRESDALSELNEILEVEQRMYGQSSLQTGKTHKFIGNVYLSQNRNLEAISHLKKALKIHEENGLKRGCDEIKKSLMMAKTGYNKRIDT